MFDYPNIIIETEQLTKKYNNIIAVNNINLKVSRGEIFSFLGPKGSGKSTIVGMLVGLITPTSGRVRLFNKSLDRHLSEILPLMGIMNENHGLYPYLSGWDNLHIFSRIMGSTGTNNISRVLDIVGLSTSAKDKVKNYSHGMKRRLIIASVLLHDPQLIILDEPTSGLDPAEMKKIRELIIELGKVGKTIFLSSHLLQDVEHVCNKVAIIDNGNVLIQGEVKSIIKSHNIIQLKIREIDKAMILLKEQPWITNIYRDDGYILLEEPINKTEDISKLLTQNNISISEVIVRQNNLENFLLQLSGNYR